MDLLNTPRSRGRYVFDLETDGLLDEVSVIHCAVIYDIDTEELIGFRPHELGKFLKLYRAAKLLIGHNIIGYDIPVIGKLYGLTPPADCELIDTLPLARLIYSDIKQDDFPKAKAWKKFKEARDRYEAARLESKARWEEEERELLALYPGEDIPDKPWLDPGPYRGMKAPPEFPGQFCGSHSLEAWGYRLGQEKKGDYSKEMKAKGLDPWEKFNEDMFEYMLQDARVNVLLYRHLIEQEGYSALAVALEMDCQALVCRMERNGWPLDVHAARELYAALQQRRFELDRILQEAFPPWRIQLEDFIPKRNNKTKGYIAGVPVERWETITFNPASREHIADRLSAKYGWTPTEFTDGGAAKVDDEILKSLKYPEAAALAEYFTIQKRIGQLAEGGQAWLQQVTKKGRIHARYNSNGALTGRATHSKPNIAQVPAVRAEYGRDCRVLFTVPRGWSQLGADQSGLELRCLGSFLAPFDGGKYAEVVLHGDVHWENAKALFGLPANKPRYEEFDEDGHGIGTPANEAKRDVAKTFIYAFLYGAGPEKLGSIPGVTAEERKSWKASPDHVAALKAIQKRFAKRRQPIPTGTRLCHIYKGELLTASFLKTFPALKKLLKVVKAAAGKGWLKGLDGRKLPIRSEHAALNTLLQSAGAVICKSWIVQAEKDIVASGLRISEGFGPDWDKDADVVFLGWIHDEIQVAVREGLEEKVSALIIAAGRRAGDPFASWRCPTDVEVKPGKNWADCH